MQIGLRLYSDHSPVIIECLVKGLKKTRSVWRMDSFLLLNRETVNHIQADMVLFLHQMVTPLTRLCWVIFKDYIRGVLISQKAYLNKKKMAMSTETLAEIGLLERQYELTGNKDIKWDMEVKTNIFKLLDASQAAKEIMYARQHFFEYHDKPNKQLAQVLAEDKGQHKMPEVMMNKDGEKLAALEDKLCIFAPYYTELYKSMDLSEENIKSFLDIVDFPCFTDEHRLHFDSDITYFEIERAGKIGEESSIGWSYCRVL